MTIDKNCDLYVTGWIKVRNNRDIIVYKLDGSNSGAVLWSDQRGGSHNTYLDTGSCNRKLIAQGMFMWLRKSILRLMA